MEGWGRKVRANRNRTSKGRDGLCMRRRCVQACKRKDIREVIQEVAEERKKN
jgi:hypothetical protein